MARENKFPQRFQSICDQILEEAKHDGVCCTLTSKANTLPILNGFERLGALKRIRPIASIYRRTYELTNRSLIQSLRNKPPASNAEEWVVYLHTQKPFTPPPTSPELDVKQATQQVIVAARKEKNYARAILQAVKQLLKEVDYAAKNIPSRRTNSHGEGQQPRY